MNCQAQTKKNQPCKRKASSGTYCKQHTVDECCICYNETNLMSTDVCVHTLCRSCLKRVDTCPMCRVSLPSKIARENFDQFNIDLEVRTRNAQSVIHNHMLRVKNMFSVEEGRIIPMIINGNMYTIRT